MKKQILNLASLFLVVGLAMVSANAQAGGIRVNVPFNFTVSGKSFPTGEYTMVAASRQVNIQNARGTVVAMVLANDISGRSAGETGEIIFHCYRERCFLSEIWSPAWESGRQLLTSRTEEDLAKQGDGKYFAVLGEKPRK